jgi:hypothetical protein
LNAAGFTVNGMSTALVVLETLSGGRAARHDKLLLRRLVNPDTRLGRVGKHLRLEECWINKRWSARSELSIVADTISVSNCYFHLQTLLSTSGGAFVAEDCLFQTSLSTRAAKYDFARCFFESRNRCDYLLSECGEKGAARFCDCAFGRGCIVTAHDLEFVGCSWDRLWINVARHGISLRVDGRALDLGDAAALARHSIARC